MVGILFIGLVGLIVVVGLGVLIAYLAKQTKGAKGAIDEGRRLQAELDSQVENDQDEDTGPGA